MSYVNAPATKLLATHCCACGRPLVDAQSVEAGMGPDCRKRYALPESLTEEQRTRANKLVYAIAREQVGPEVGEALSELRQLGCHTLADRLIKRLGGAYTAVIVNEGDRFAVKAPYCRELVRAFQSIPGRRWDKQRKLTTFPVNAKFQVFRALQARFLGEKCLGPKGEFVL